MDESILQRLINDDKVMKLVQLVRDGEVTTKDLQAIRQAQLVPDIRLYQRFYEFHTHNLLEGGDCEAIEGDPGLRGVYEKGELIALGILTQGDPGQIVVVPEGLAGVVTSYQQSDPQKSLFTLLMKRLGQPKFFDKTVVRMGLLNITDDYDNFSVPRGDAFDFGLNTYVHRIFRAGYSGVVGAAMQTEALRRAESD
jgi:hypothetical protein